MGGGSGSHWRGRGGGPVSFPPARFSGNTFIAPGDFFSLSHVAINISAGGRAQQQRRIIPEGM